MSTSLTKATGTVSFAVDSVFACTRDKFRLLMAQENFLIHGQKQQQKRQSRRCLYNRTSHQCKLRNVCVCSEQFTLASLV